MKKNYIVPQNRVIDLKLEAIVCTSPVSICINKDDAYEGDGAVDVRELNSNIDWDEEW